MQDTDRETRINQTDARAGSNNGVVRWVLAISLSLAIIALTLIWVTGALTQDDVESQGTATGRIEAQSEQRDDLAGEVGLAAPGADERTEMPAPPA